MRRRGGDKEKRPLNIDWALTRLLSHMENVHIKSKHIIFGGLFEEGPILLGQNKLKILKVGRYNLGK